MPTIAVENSKTIENFVWLPLRVSRTRTPDTPPLPPKPTKRSCTAWPASFAPLPAPEQIHAANHAHVINQWGLRRRVRDSRSRGEGHAGKPEDRAERREVRDRHDVSGVPGRGLGERKNLAAIRTFTGALEAEKTHARLFSEAIALLAAGKRDSRSGSWVGEAQRVLRLPGLRLYLGDRRGARDAARYATARGSASRLSGSGAAGSRVL